MYLKERCTEAENGSCNLYSWQMLVALGGENPHKSQLGYTYCDDLGAVGYIKIHHGDSKDKKTFITREIYF